MSDGKIEKQTFIAYNSNSLKVKLSDYNRNGDLEMKLKNYSTSQTAAYEQNAIENEIETYPSSPSEIDVSENESEAQTT